MLRDIDRKFLSTTMGAAQEARRPPPSVGLPLEPTWAALIADPAKILASAVFRQGDAEDAVRAAWKQISGKIPVENLTLYLTLEPRPTYQRLAPVTESIRATGIHRVVIGTEDPFHRERGQGIAALRNYGLEVVLADGEEARSCQLLYEDYAKASNRFVPQLKLVCELAGGEGEGNFTMEPAPERIPGRFDALLLELSTLYRKDFVLPKGAWLVVLDSYAGLPLDSPIVKEHAKRMIACVSKSPETEAKLAPLKKAGIQVLSVPPKDGSVDLALVLRKLRDLGFFALYSAEGKDLWKTAIQAGLVDTALCHLRQSYDPVRTLSVLERAKLDYVQGTGLLQFQLARPRWLEQSGDGFWIEAEIVERSPLP